MGTVTKKRDGVTMPTTDKIDFKAKMVMGERIFYKDKWVNSKGRHNDYKYIRYKGLQNT